MSDDLVKLLRFDHPDQLTCEAADRIEELEKDVRKWQAKHDTWRAMALSAETNLEVAVGSLDELMDINDNGGPFGGELYRDRVDRAWDRARATLAELKGQGND